MTSRTAVLSMLATSPDPLSALVWEQIVGLPADELEPYLKRTDVPAAFASRLVSRWDELSRLWPLIWRVLPVPDRVELIDSGAPLPTLAAEHVGTLDDGEAELAAFLRMEAIGSGRNLRAHAELLCGLVANTHLTDERRARVAADITGRWLAGWGGEIPQNPFPRTILDVLVGKLPGRVELLATLNPPAVCDHRELELWWSAAVPYEERLYPAWKFVGDPELFAAVAGRVLTLDADTRPRWVIRLASVVRKTPKLLPSELRAQFLDAAADVGSAECQAAIRKLTRRPAPDRAGDALRAALAQVAAGASDALVTDTIAEISPHAVVSFEVLAEALDSPGVSTQVAWQLVERFGPREDKPTPVAVRLATLRRSDLDWAAELIVRNADDLVIFERKPSAVTYPLLDALDPDTVAAAAPQVLATFVAKENSPSPRTPPASWEEVAKRAGAHLSDLSVPDAFAVAAHSRSATAYLTAVLSVAPVVAAELADGFDGTVAEFRDLLSCTV